MNRYTFSVYRNIGYVGPISGDLDLHGGPTYHLPDDRLEEHPHETSHLVHQQERLHEEYRFKIHSVDAATSHQVLYVGADLEGHLERGSEPTLQRYRY